MHLPLRLWALNVLCMKSSIQNYRTGDGIASSFAQARDPDYSFLLRDSMPCTAHIALQAYACRQVSCWALARGCDLCAQWTDPLGRWPGSLIPRKPRVTGSECVSSSVEADDLKIVSCQFSHLVRSYGWLWSRNTGFSKTLAGTAGETTKVCDVHGVHWSMFVTPVLGSCIRAGCLHRSAYWSSCQKTSCAELRGCLVLVVLR